MVWEAVHSAASRRHNESVAFNTASHQNSTAGHCSSLLNTALVRKHPTPVPRASPNYAQVLQSTVATSAVLKNGFQFRQCCTVGGATASARGSTPVKFGSMMRRTRSSTDSTSLSGVEAPDVTPTRSGFPGLSQSDVSFSSPHDVLCLICIGSHLIRNCNRLVSTAVQPSDDCCVQPSV